MHAALLGIIRWISCATPISCKPAARCILSLEPSSATVWGRSTRAPWPKGGGCFKRPLGSCRRIWPVARFYSTAAGSTRIYAWHAFCRLTMSRGCRCQTTPKWCVGIGKLNRFQLGMPCWPACMLRSCRQFRGIASGICGKVHLILWCGEKQTAIGKNPFAAWPCHANLGIVFKFGAGVTQCSAMNSK